MATTKKVLLKGSLEGDYLLPFTNNIPLDPATLKLNESGNVTVETGGVVDESRLLPQNPANGAIPCFSSEPPAGVNYNDEDTIYYINAKNGNTDNKANAANVSGFVVTPSGFPDVTDNSWVIPRLDQIALNISDSTYLKSTNEAGFTFDFYLKTTNFASTSRKENTLIYDNNFVYLANHQLNQAGKGFIWFYGSSDSSEFATIFDNGVPQLISIDAWRDDAGKWNVGVYINGVLKRILSDTSRLSEITRLFGQDNWGNYIDDVTVYYVRISKVARYKGQSFESPGAAGYAEPPAGYWGTLNKSGLVQSVNGQTPDSSGAVTIPLAGEQMDGSVIDGLISGASFKKLVDRFIGKPDLPLLSSVDLNTMTETGFYAVSNPTNAPTDTGYYYLLVHRWGQGTVYNWQLACNVQTREVYTRCTDAPATWNAWQKILNGADIGESKASPGYFKLPGGTIVQYGTADISSTAASNEIILPLAYPVAISTALATYASSESILVTASAVGLTRIKFNIHSPEDEPFVEPPSYWIGWLTIGY